MKSLVNFPFFCSGWLKLSPGMGTDRVGVMNCGLWAGATADAARACAGAQKNVTATRAAASRTVRLAARGSDIGGKFCFGRDSDVFDIVHEKGRRGVNAKRQALAASAQHKRPRLAVFEAGGEALRVEVNLLRYRRECLLGEEVLRGKEQIVDGPIFPLACRAMRRLRRFSRKRIGGLIWHVFPDMAQSLVGSKDSCDRNFEVATMRAGVIAEGHDGHVRRRGPARR